MPKYLVEMHDGRKFQVEADSQPTEDEVMAHLGGGVAPKAGEGPAMTRSVLGHPLGASEGEPSALDNLNDAMTQIAHPQSLGELSGLLLTNNVGPLAARAGAMVTRPLAAGARVAANALESVPAIKNVLPFANPAKQLIPFGKMAGRLRTVAQTAQDADMGVTRGADMYSMRTVPRSTDSLALKLNIGHGEPAAMAGVARAAEQAPSALSDVERAQLVKQGYSPDLINKIAEQAGAAKGGVIRTTGRIEPVPSHAPTGPDMVPVGDEAAYNAAHASPSPTTQGDVQLLPKDQIRRDLMDPEMVRKANEMQRGAAAAAPITPPDMAAQEARFNRGSERLGREQGMTRGDAQAQTDSVQGTRAETSLVAPWQAQQRMMAKMEALRQADPTGRSIVEYIDQAADPKTKAALINWERQSAFSAGRAPFYALAGAAVAPSVRDMLLQKMRAGVTGGSTPTQ